MLTGRHSLPLYRLPIMMSAQRHFSYNGAMLDFSVSHAEGQPGDGVPASAAAGGTATAGAGGPGGSGGGASGKGLGANEDVPGVPTQAWLRVARGIPPAEPFTPGERATQPWACAEGEHRTNDLERGWMGAVMLLLVVVRWRRRLQARAWWWWWTRRASCRPTSR